MQRADSSTFCFNIKSLCFSLLLFVSTKSTSTFILCLCTDMMLSRTRLICICCVALPRVLCLLRCLPSWKRLSGVELTGSALAANLASRPSPLSSQPPSSSESDSSSSSSSEVSVSEERFSAQRGMWLHIGSGPKGQISSYCFY